MTDRRGKRRARGQRGEGEAAVMWLLTPLYSRWKLAKDAGDMSLHNSGCKTFSRDGWREADSSQVKLVVTHDFTISIYHTLHLRLPHLESRLWNHYLCVDNSKIVIKTFTLKISRLVISVVVRKARKLHTKKPSKFLICNDIVIIFSFYFFVTAPHITPRR